MHPAFNRFGAYGTMAPTQPSQGPVQIADLLPAIGTAVGNVLVSSKPAVQRAAELQADLAAAVARGAPLATIANLKQKLQAAQYEVAQQQAWDSQQQEILGGVRALQGVGVLLGIALIGLVVKKIIAD